MKTLIWALTLFVLVVAAVLATRVSGEGSTRSRSRLPITMHQPPIPGLSGVDGPIPVEGSTGQRARIEDDAAGVEIADLNLWIGRLRRARTRGDESACVAARAAIARMGLAAAGNVLVTLLESDPQLRVDVVSLLVAIGDDAVLQRLVEGLTGLEEPDLLKPKLRLIVSLVRSTKSIAALGRLLEPDASVQLACLGAQVFKELRDPRAIPILLQGLWREDATVRKAIAEALEGTPDPEVVPEIERHYRQMRPVDIDAKIIVGRTIARSLPPLLALQVLSDLVGGDDPNDASAARFGLSMIAKDDSALQEILNRIRTDPRDSVRRALLSTLFVAPNDRVESALVEFIDTEPSPILRRQALIVAGRKVPAPIVESFAGSFIASSDPQDRAAGCMALRNVLSCGRPEPEARSMLLGVIENEAFEPMQRVLSIQVLARHPDEETRRVFAEVKARTEDASVRAAIDRIEGF